MFKASGEEALSIPYEEFVQMLVLGEQPVTALAVKRHLQGRCGQPRFRQRLLLPDGQILSDNADLGGPMDMQLILQPFIASSAEQIKQPQLATSENDILTMELPLQRPQDPDLESDGMPPALHFASIFDRSEASCLLLEASADKDKTDNAGCTPLFISSKKGHLKLVQVLVDANADKDKSDSNGHPPIYVASAIGHLEVVRLLLQANADKDKSSRDGFTPVYIASRHGHLEVVRLLLQAKADKDKPNSLGRRVLGSREAVATGQG